MKRIEKNKFYLLLLADCKSKKFKRTLLENCGTDALKAILEIVLNVMKGNVKVSEKVRRKLKKYKSSLRKLICPQLSLKSKRKVLIQSGGFLNILLPTLIGGILNHILQKNEHGQ
jgi:hypothetical protein